jgi:starch phosphorylase
VTAATRVDAVCGMRVSAAGSPSVTYDGREYSFCSEFCRRAFVADPIGYVYEQQAAGEFALRAVAYFSMEIALATGMNSYAGGLGVLAGDALRSAADLGLPLVGVTLRNASGYFRQQLGPAGQSEQPDDWPVEAFARQLEARVEVRIGGRPVRIAAWRHDVAGADGGLVPVLLLDTDLEDNHPGDRDLTRYLYGGDSRFRLSQEVVLGVGGARMLEALGFRGLRRFHMNEGHAALLALELLRRRHAEVGGDLDFEWVRSRCVFTTHTPVPAGHDQYDWTLVREVLAEEVPFDVVRMLGGADRLNMTQLALDLSRYVNGVARRHGEVSRGMFPTHLVDAITNGVHSVRWTSTPFQRLYDRRIPSWRADPQALRHGITLPPEEVWQAHAEAKHALFDALAARAPGVFLADVFTIAFARRATSYKRADLVLTDPERLASIAAAVGRLQIVFAGKAHPRDEGGKALIRRVREVAERLRGRVAIAWLEGYDVELASALTAGADLWLNTPIPPLEASGTSGMKAAHNGVPQLSVLDGWWVEGWIEGVTGWSVGPGPELVLDEAARRARELDDLYGKLERTILPLYYDDRARWIDVMRGAIAFNASFFNSHRMVAQYAAHAWL